jgi:hypothetical protein
MNQGPIVVVIRERTVVTKVIGPFWDINQADDYIEEIRRVDCGYTVCEMVLPHDPTAR